MAATLALWCVIGFLIGVVSASVGWNIYLVLGVGFLLGFGFLFLKSQKQHTNELENIGVSGEGNVANSITIQQQYSYKLKNVRVLLLRFALVAVFVVAGAFYYRLYINLSNTQNIPLNQKLAFTGIVADEPKNLEKYDLLTINPKPPYSGSISILNQPSTVIKYGDLLKIDGLIQPPQTERDLPISFFPKTEIIGEHQGFWLKEKLLDVKQALLAQFKLFLPQRESALMQGITLGARGDFSADFKDKMAAAGVTHIVALSGYNITVLVTAVALVSGYFLSRRRTFYITLAIIVLFVFMTGAEASVVRASIMGFLALLAKEIGRVYMRLNIIAFTALVMTLANPTVLIYDIGFVLSFLSLLGIVYLSPAITKLLKFESPGILNWRQNAVTTLSAQLAVMPVGLIYFNRFSLLAPLANILILEFMPLTMFFGFLLSALGWLYSYLGFFTSTLVHILLTYEVGVINVFAKFNVPLPLNVFGSWVAVAVYYVGLVFLTIRFSPKREHDDQ